jgi:hypothetical protein
VVLVGDSFTEVGCVETPARWSDRIERARAAQGGPSVELINCGEAGTHPVDYARTLVQLGLDFEPDAVVVGIYFDDVPNTPAGLDPAGLLRREAPAESGLHALAWSLWPHALTLATRPDPRRGARGARGSRDEGEQRKDLVALAQRTARERVLDEAGFERWRRAVPDELLAAAGEGRVAPGLLTHVLTRPEFFEEGIGLETEDAQARMRALAGLLDALNALCRDRGARFGVVLMPSVHQYDPRSGERPMARLYAALDHPVREEWKRETTGLQRELSAWAGRAGVPFLDLVPVFRAAVGAAEQPLNYAIDPHWTPAGHALAAEAIQAWMEAGGLLPPAGPPR